MSSDKSGSDLDVFDDLKPQSPDGTPITETKKTLMGIPVPEDVLPPVPGSLGASAGAPTASGGRSGPPPPPSQRPSSAGPPPPPSSRRSNPDLTPVTPPSVEALTEATPGRGAGQLGSLEAPADEAGDERAEDTSRDVPALSDVVAPPQGSGPPGSGLGLDSWATSQPRPSSPSPRISAPPEPRISAVPPPAAVASAASPASASSPPTDVGWDDDDDKTTIYDKDTQAAAQSLLSPAAPTGTSGRPPPPLSRPPGAVMPPTTMGGFRSTAPPLPHEASFPAPPPASSGQKLPYLLAVMAAALVALLVLVVLPKKGALTVTVAGGPGNKPLSDVEVIVDNKLRCNESPCELTGLKPGTHYVEVRAAGYQATAKSAVAVVGSQTAVHNVQLIRAGTGIKVFGEGEGLRLSVDGQDYGPLPQELRQMEPGEHVVQVTGGSRYEPFQQRLTVDPDQMTPIGPIKLKVVKGLATIKAGANAEGAEVMLKVGNSRRMLPALPVRLEVETKRTHVLVAKRKGYATFEEPIAFEDGQAEKTITIDLSERRERPARSPRPSPPAATSSSGAAGASRTASDTGQAKLTLRSSPPSNVVLDGKPLGHTPHAGVVVEPGQHRVIFIHGPERKAKTVSVAAGDDKTVSVSF